VRAEPTVVALVPAKDAVGSIAATVTSLRATGALSDIVVIDDGSSDGTGDTAAAVGATVLRLPRNIGKAGAVTAGIAANPHVDVYLLVDADTGDSAGAAVALLAPVLADEADMAIANLPSAGKKAGFGLVNNTARKGIALACGYVAARPLSGQRAIRGELLRSVRLAPRYGMEVSMTVDVVRRGGRVVEIPVDMTHRHTGRSLAGFLHRGRQGIDVVIPLVPRLLVRRNGMKG
jgi:glycosyltransferase involved in cell wall biosynthesis